MTYKKAVDQFSHNPLEKYFNWW